MAIRVYQGSNNPLQKVHVASGLYHWAVTLKPGEKRENPAVQHAFDNIISEKAYEILRQGSAVVGEMGEGAKFYGDLKECGSTVLVRTSTNTSRNQFENIVVNKVGRLAIDGQNDSIHITACVMGLLFSEFVLLSRCINDLSEKKISKNIIFNLIDRNYEVLEEDFVEDYADEEGALRWKIDVDKAVIQLLYTVESVISFPRLNFHSNVELRFFKSDKDYINTCRMRPEYRHDLLVGVDSDVTDDVIVKLDGMRRGDVDALFLERRRDQKGNDRPFLHSINSATNKSEYTVLT